MNTADPHVKVREIRFCRLPPARDPAASALAVLAGLPELEEVRWRGPFTLEVRYDLRRTRLETLERMLEDSGFHLDNGLTARLRRALVHYTEEVEAETLDAPERRGRAYAEIYAESYRHRPHGCRDPRPEHWREYR